MFKIIERRHYFFFFYLLFNFLQFKVIKLNWLWYTQKNVQYSAGTRVKKCNNKVKKKFFVDLKLQFFSYGTTSTGLLFSDWLKKTRGAYFEFFYHFGQEFYAEFWKRDLAKSKARRCRRHLSAQNQKCVHKKPRVWDKTGFLLEKLIIMGHTFGNLERETFENKDI